MPERHFPPPWTVEETAPCFIVALGGHRGVRKQLIGSNYQASIAVICILIG
jgi:hypothetical protein